MEAGVGSIPAWAGKPHQSPERIGLDQVYPRVGGETRRHIHAMVQPRGLSPRGRGNRHSTIIMR